MEIAVMTSLFAKGDMNINTCHVWMKKSYNLMCKSKVNYKKAVLLRNKAAGLYSFFGSAKARRSEI